MNQNDFIRQARQLFNQIPSTQAKDHLPKDDRELTVALLAFLAHDTVAMKLDNSFTSDLLTLLFRYAYLLGYQDGQSDEPKLDNVWFESD